MSSHSEWYISMKNSIPFTIKQYIRPHIPNPSWCSAPGFEMLVHNNFMYVTGGFGSGIITKVSMIDGSVIDSVWATVPNTNGLGQMVISGNYLYVANYTGINGGGGQGGYTGTNIVQINLSDGSIANENWCTGLTGPFGLVIVGSYMYSTNYSVSGASQGNDSVAKINMSDGSIVNLHWCSGLSYPISLAQSGNYLYTPVNTGIAKISLTDGSVNTTWFATSTFTPFIAISGNDLYYTDYGSGTGTFIVNLTSASIVDTSYFNGISAPNAITFSGNQIYVATSSGIYTLAAFSNNNLCFHEDTMILTDRGYLYIHNLKPGDLVKTCNHGYVPIESIGHSQIYNPGNHLRSKSCLFKCSPANYPELLEDLIITGCHSILVDDLTQKQKDDTVDMLGRLMITDNKYRLMACLDDRSIPWSEEGIHSIWHLALEHKDPKMNYGIYANGLLVETTSIRMMHTFSGMELV